MKINQHSAEHPMDQMKWKKETEIKVTRRKEIKFRTGINETEDRKSVVKINQINSWFFEKINKIARLTKEKRERTQMNKIRNEKGDITTDSMEIQRFIEGYYEQLYTNKLYNLEEMGKKLETYNLLRLNQEEIVNLKD